MPCVIVISSDVQHAEPGAVLAVVLPRRRNQLRGAMPALGWQCLWCADQVRGSMIMSSVYLTLIKIICTGPFNLTQFLSRQSLLTAAQQVLFIKGTPGSFCETKLGFYCGREKSTRLRNGRNENSMGIFIIIIYNMVLIFLLNFLWT